MKNLKRIFKRNTHNPLFKGLAGFGRSLHRLYENRNHDIYSNGELTVIKKIVSLNPKIIIDGGANVGDYSRRISEIYQGAKIYAFEPVEGTFNELVGNTKQFTNVEPIMKGLFSKECTKEINVFNSSEHASLYDIKGISNTSEKTTKIELIKGDDFLTEKNIDSVDFLKLDLEGAEYDAILGFENTFKNGKVRAVQFEYGYINISSKKLLIDFYELLNDYGFQVGKIFPKSVEFREYEFKHEDFVGPNFISVNKKDEDLIQLLKKGLT